ncbi:hypothetical protein AAFF_G00233650 [Aldrovandia affinis]|uniref:Claudin n=1 Tax=Aldrovandia affinis TaxID=143900 RepID=A0AAD7W4C6_9TELE|nr:hypothetical protein AAFF_G00233650 [Aldrovandia affinis]
MGQISKEVTGQVFCFVGFVLVCLVCGIPMWRVTTFVGANIVTGQIIWDGLWMNCVMQSTGQMQCSIHQFLLRLSRDLQAARALIVSALVIAFVGLAFTFIGAKCISCLKREDSMAKVVILGGVVCIVAGVITVIPVTWSAATTILDFESVGVIESQRRELGAAIYIGWAAAGLLIIGGSILCTSCPRDERKYQYYPTQYSYAGSVVMPGPYAKPYPGSMVTPGPYAKPYPGSMVTPVPYAKPYMAPPPRSQYTPAQYL